MSPQQTPDADAASTGERLQKVLAAAGIGSRRKCEELITAGRVEVDRQVVTRLGTRVDPETQEIRLDGELLRVGRRAYYVVNKPRGVVSTTEDPGGRKRVIDLVPDHGERLFTVGRLDLESEGLIIVTNDGELANRLAHPRYGVDKTYLVQVAGIPEPELLARLLHGIHLAEGVARAKRVHVRRQVGQSTVLEIVLAEGKNREIRRMLAKLGHKVMWLKRIAMGGVKLGELPTGKWRRLSSPELEMLRRGGPRLAKKRAQKPPHVAGASPAASTPRGRGHRPPDKKTGSHTARRRRR